MLGSTLGGYEITRELGAGGMGTVYLGERDGQKVALKVVHPHLIATPGFFKRFMREGELGRKVEHENVVRTLDIDATMLDGAQVNYMVMEYVEGKSLRALLNDLGTVPEALLREIARQAAAGLAAIHAADIVHRDLKPENILITDDEVVRIMDLGVAKLQEASVAITKEGQFAGSVLYAAPEQFKRDDVGPATDQYSLGVLLYELATGQNPFRSDDAAAVIQAHLHEVAPPAHERSPELSLFLSEVIATLLQKQAKRRFASAAELHDVLAEGEKSAWWAEREPKLRKRETRLPRIRVSRETELHGRDKELALLRECFALATEGKGNSVYLEGEAGIGKTRLVDAFLREVGDANVLYGSYPPSGGLGGFSEGILGRFGEVGLADTLKPYLTVTPSLVPAFAALVRHEAPPSGAEPLQGEALQAVAVHLMRALAAEKPTIWVVDDLHFAPAESQALVLSLARAAEGHRVLLVLSGRPGVELADFTRLDNFRRVELGRLSPREVVHLLREAFRSELLADKLGAKIAVKSDGVPFFVFEMIRGLKEGQFITQDADGTYVQTQVVDDIEVPSAVKDLIEQRMRDLSESQRAILDAGAVQGVTFDPDIVAEVVEERPIRVLRELADIERRHGLVRGDGEMVRFDQNQIQEVLYRELLPKLRREYHAMTADAYEGDDPYFLAYHHLRGRRPKKAQKHLEPALDQLAESYRNEAVVELANRALEVDGLLAGEERVKVLLRLARCLGLLGRRAEERTILDEAVAAADETGDAASRSRARVALGFLLSQTAGADEAQSHVAEALEIARGCGDVALEATASEMAGVVSSFAGKQAEALDHYQRARSLREELGDHAGVDSIDQNVAIVHWQLGRIDEARELMKRFLGRHSETGNRYQESRLRNNLGLMCSETGRPTEAREHFERALEIDRATGHRQGEATVVGNLGNLHLRLGYLGLARDCYRRHQALSRETGHRRGEGIALVNLGPLQATLGQTDEARASLDESLRILHGIEARREEGYALHGLGELLEQVGDTESARQWYEQALALRREISYSSGAASTLTTLGRLEADPALLDEALAVARETGSPKLVFEATLERARLPGGDVAAALTALGSIEAEVGPVGRYRLWQLTNDATHLEEAKRLLDFRVEHAPPDCRESMIENVPLHREIMEAWNDR